MTNQVQLDVLVPTESEGKSFLRLLPVGLQNLINKAPETQLRLFACRCARSSLALCDLSEPRLIECIQAAEGSAKGDIGSQALQRVLISRSSLPEGGLATHSISSEQSKSNLRQICSWAYRAAFGCALP